MSIITKQEIRNFSATINTQTRTAHFSKPINLAQAKARAIKTVFLSHSHSERDIIEPVVVLLKSVGVNVYVDWKDSSMPAITDATTATKLKDSIKNHDRFILLASPSAIKSNWVNWELGYGDAQKYIANIAIFPTEDHSGEWKDAEYLRIYPRIEKIREINANTYRYEDKYYVIHPDGTKINLYTWLNR